MARNLPMDGSAAKKVKITASCFMGMSHILYLKEYMKGILFGFMEILFLLLSPFFVREIIGLITLGEPQLNVPLLKRNNSIFMLIDGILVLAVIFVFVILYVISVRSAGKSYKKYCTMQGGFVTKEINDGYR